MKMVMAVYSEGIDSEVMEVLDAFSLTSYTKWTKVLGCGNLGGPRLDSHIWPGANNTLVVVLDDDKAAALMESFTEFKEAHRREGFKAFLLPVEGMV